MARKLLCLVGLPVAFILGAISTFIALPYVDSDYSYEQILLGGHKTTYSLLAKTAYWDILIPVGSKGRGVSLGQKGVVRATILDDGPSLYVLTYKDKESRVFEGRLMDIGNDGTIEVANITGGQCELNKK